MRGVFLYETSASLKAKHEKNKKPVKFGDHYFDSVRAAGKHFGISGSTVGNKIRKKIPINGLFGQYISKDEYNDKTRTSHNN